MHRRRVWFCGQLFPISLGLILRFSLVYIHRCALFHSLIAPVSGPLHSPASKVVPWSAPSLRLASFLQHFTAAPESHHRACNSFAADIRLTIRPTICSSGPISRATWPAVCQNRRTGLQVANACGKQTMWASTYSTNENEHQSHISQCYLASIETHSLSEKTPFGLFSPDIGLVTHITWSKRPSVAATTPQTPSAAECQPLRIPLSPFRTRHVQKGLF